MCNFTSSNIIYPLVFINYYIEQEIMRASAVNKNTDTSLYTKKELITWIYDLLKVMKQ